MVRGSPGRKSRLPTHSLGTTNVMYVCVYVLGCPNKTFFKSSQVSPYRKFPYDQNTPHKKLNFRSFEQYLKVPQDPCSFFYV